MTNTDDLLLLLEEAPGTNASEGILTHVGGEVKKTYVNVDYPGNLGEAATRKLWKNGKSNVTTASLAAALCSEADLLDTMAHKDTRQSVYSAIATNPNTHLKTLLYLEKHTSGWRGSMDKIVEVIHKTPLTPELSTLCYASQSWSAVKGLLSHPDQTQEALMHHLQGDPTRAKYIMDRTDIMEMEDLLDLVTSDGQYHMAQNMLVRRGDAKDLHTKHLVKIVKMLEARVIVSAMEGLEEVVYDNIIGHLEAASDAAKEAWQYRQAWQNLGKNKSVPATKLGQAPLSRWTISILGGLLTTNFGDDKTAWEIASGLMGQFQEKPCQDLVDCATALMS